MFLEELFTNFLKEKTFLTGVSPKTIRSYQQAFNAYQRVLSAAGQFQPETTPTKDTLKGFVIGMRESGLSPGACNVYIRSVNSYLSWLHENSHVTAFTYLPANHGSLHRLVRREMLNQLDAGIHFNVGVSAPCLPCH